MPKLESRNIIRMVLMTKSDNGWREHDVNYNVVLVHLFFGFWATLRGDAIYLLKSDCMPFFEAIPSIGVIETNYLPSCWFCVLICGTNSEESHRLDHRVGEQACV